MSKKIRIKLAALSLLAIGILFSTAMPYQVTIEPSGRVSVDTYEALAAPGWESPTSSVANGWSAPGDAWDDNTATYALYDIPAASWSPYLELLHAAIDCDKVQVFIGLEKDGTNIDTMELDVYYSGAYNNIYTGVVTTDTWQEYAIGSEESVTAMQARFYNNHNSQPREVYFYEADFWEVEACTPDISNTPTTYDFGAVSESTNYTTGLDYFNVTNNSGGAIDISIQSTNMTGGNGWTLSDTATPDADIFGLKTGTSGDGDYTTIVKANSPYNNLITGLADSANTTWGVKLITPTSHSDGAEKECTVTLTATCQ